MLCPRTQDRCLSSALGYIYIFIIIILKGWFSLVFVNSVPHSLGLCQALFSYCAPIPDFHVDFLVHLQTRLIIWQQCSLGLLAGPGCCHQPCSVFLAWLQWGGQWPAWFLSPIYIIVLGSLFLREQILCMDPWYQVQTWLLPEVTKMWSYFWVPALYSSVLHCPVLFVLQVSANSNINLDKHSGMVVLH